MRISDWSSDVCSSDLTRRIDWPANEFSWARVAGRYVVVFIGVEPNVHWRTYCEQILAVCSELGASVLVTLGAFLADRSEERRVGKGCVSTGRSRWSPYLYKKQTPDLYTQKLID